MFVPCVLIFFLKRRMFRWLIDPSWQPPRHCHPSSHLRLTRKTHILTHQSIILLAQSVTGSNEWLKLTSGHEGLPNFKVAGGCATCLCSLFRASFRAWTVDMMLFLLVIPWWIGSFATLVFVNIDLSLIRLTLILFQHRVNGRSFPLVYSPEFLSRISPPNFMFYDPLKMGMAIKTLFKPTHSQGHS